MHHPSSGRTNKQQEIADFLKIIRKKYPLFCILIGTFRHFHEMVVAFVETEIWKQASCIVSQADGNLSNCTSNNWQFSDHPGRDFDSKHSKSYFEFVRSGSITKTHVVGLSCIFHLYPSKDGSPRKFSLNITRIQLSSVVIVQLCKQTMRILWINSQNPHQ